MCLCTAKRIFFRVINIPWTNTQTRTKTDFLKGILLFQHSVTTVLRMVDKYVSIPSGEFTTKMKQNCPFRHNIWLRKKPGFDENKYGSLNILGFVLKLHKHSPINKINYWTVICKLRYASLTITDYEMWVSSFDLYWVDFGTIYQLFQRYCFLSLLR